MEKWQKSLIFKVPRLVKVTQADSPYFEIISPHDVGHKVGPGLPTTFKLQFRPEEKKVRHHSNNQIFIYTVTSYSW